MSALKVDKTKKWTKYGSRSAMLASSSSFLIFNDSMSSLKQLLALVWYGFCDNVMRRTNRFANSFILSAIRLLALKSIWKYVLFLFFYLWEKIRPEGHGSRFGPSCFLEGINGSGGNITSDKQKENSFIGTQTQIFHQTENKENRQMVLTVSHSFWLIRKPVT